jgi:hypothetical protein
MSANNEWTEANKDATNARKSESVGSRGSRGCGGRHESSVHRPCDDCGNLICKKYEPKFGDVQCQHRDHVWPDEGGICNSCWYDNHEENCESAWYANINYKIFCKAHSDDPDKTTWEEHVTSLQ